MKDTRGYTKEEWFYYHPKKEDTTKEVVHNLILRYGLSATLSEIQDKVNNTEFKHCGYKCPKCGGKGYTVKQVNTYPTGLPDSGWVDDPKYYKDFYYTCDLCKGEGYTAEEYVPKTETKIIGYEVKK